MSRVASFPRFHRIAASRHQLLRKRASPHRHIAWHAHRIDPDQRAAQKQQTPCVLWFTGLSGAGKSTLANGLDEALFRLGHHAFVLDGDNLRHGLSSDLGFSDADRSESSRRVGEVARLLVDAGLFVIVATIAPFRADRDKVRARLPQGRFIEIHVDAPLALCEQRDPKGLYRRARTGEIRNFTGIDSPYERPHAPELVIDTSDTVASICVDKVLDYMRLNRLIDA